ncbi:phosphoribosylglycinamide formyltransferase [Gemmatimonas sp.]|uniref:phosphoribosylglycinamide formyltransferase n=1 Tax=Gemmatimonas sp. TaxID=1962908 RepID=UPI0039832140
MMMPASPHTPARISVLTSGGGSNLQALIDHFAGLAACAGVITFVASDHERAGALQRARDARIATGVLDAPLDSDALLSLLETAKTDVLVLAGYLKLVPEGVVRAFRGRLLNIHPALLPAFGGPGMYGKRIHAAVLEHGATITGVTVHFVDEHFDRGPIIAQWPVPVLPGDDATLLAARVLRTEHRLLPLCVAAVASGAIVLGADGRVHGHLDVPQSVHAPEWRFALIDDSPNPSPPVATAFTTEVARLFPR